MSKKIVFELHINPTAQARVRHGVSRNGFVMAFKGKKQLDNERTLEALLMGYVPNTPITGAVRLFFEASLPIAQSVSKKKREALLRGEELPTKKPDIDNLAKQILDAMTRLQFWLDDKQIVELHCRKIYGETGKWSIEVEEM